jgi:hypothetical protein
MTALVVGLCVASVMVSAARPPAQNVEAGARDTALVQALRAGGLVIVMRHASSPREAPTKERANPDNLKLERQLDEPGRRGAAAFPDWGSSVADGETVVLRPDGRGGVAVIGRIPIDEWPRLR